MPRKDLPKRLIDFLGRLECSQGEGAGKPLQVLPWQRRFIRGAFAPDAAISALSVGRGAGKSTLIGAICAAAIVGPLAQRRGDVVVAAPSYPQARICFESAREFLRPFTNLGGAEIDRSVWQIADSRNHASIEYKPTGARIRCIGHKGASAHGAQAALVILDEPAQYGETEGRKLYAAARTGLGKLPGSRLIVIGTQPEDSDHWFSRLLNANAGMSDYAQLHCAGKADNPYRRPAWHKANPSLRFMPDLLATYERDSRAAQNDDGERAAFLALRLNLGVSEIARRELISAAEWEAIEGDAERAGPYVLGCDIGDVGAMSAYAGFWPATGRLEVLGCFPTSPDLLARGKKDHVGDLYQRCANAGDIVQTGQRSASIEAALREVVDRWGYPDAVTADAFGADKLWDALEAAGIPIEPDVRRGLTAAVVDLRAFQEAMLADLVTPQPQLLLRAAMREATAHTVADGRTRLAKRNEAGRRTRARDDAAAASMLAVAYAMRSHATPEPSYQAVQMVGGEMVTV